MLRTGKSIINVEDSLLVSNEIIERGESRAQEEEEDEDEREASIKRKAAPVRCVIYGIYKIYNNKKEMKLADGTGFCASRESVHTTARIVHMCDRITCKSDRRRCIGVATLCTAL